MNILLLFIVAESQLENARAEYPYRTRWEHDDHTDPHHTGGSSAHPRAVFVRCHPDSLEVVVQADMFNTGLWVDGRHLRLGLEVVRNDVQSACRAVPSGPSEFTIQAHLMDCGTVKLPSTGEKIIYSNVLVYSPEPSSDGLIRLDGATIPVECHYNKFYPVDGLPLLPTWVPFVQRVTAENQMEFSLRLMTGDRKFERGSYTYFLGDPIYFEVSSIINNHQPLRVFIDHCVATATPDADAALRYDFIDHHGCLADAYLTNSSSRFLSRVEDHKIQFQLDAFRFYQEPSNQIYITCRLIAVPSVSTVKSQHRACSFIQNRWRAIDGNDQDCRSCGISYPVKDPPTTEPPTTSISMKTVPQLSPQIGVGRNIPKPQPANYLRIRPGMHQNLHTTPPSSARIQEVGNKEGTLKLGPLTILPSPRSSTFAK